MIIKYDILLEVDVAHGYYTGTCAADFTIEPAAATAELLSRLGLVFRRTQCGFKVFVPVIPQTDPVQLVSPLGAASLKFSFHMILHNSYFASISAIANYKPSDQLFYFSNLNEDIEVNRRFLGDHTDGTRVGNPLHSIKTNILNYTFSNPVNAATFNLEDIFGKSYTLETPSFSFPNPAEETSSYQHNLEAVAGIKSGRYVITDDQAGSLPFYYDPALPNKNVFGVIEIFTNTNDFTNPPNNLVPATYRFIENDALTGQGSYTIGFEAAQMKWMYVCRKNPANSGNGLTVNNLTIEGPVVFSKSGGDDIEERRIISDDTITAGNQQTSVILLHEGVKISDLPNPKMGTALKMENNEIFYEMYIYV
ncbi:MAG: hypothetical protein K9H16_16070 [Bacteroidales bacterium]|nr:hypothetical protein [Bacteroidales bacterium]